NVVAGIIGLIEERDRVVVGAAGDVDGLSDVGVDIAAADTEAVAAASAVEVHDIDSSQIERVGAELDEQGVEEVEGVGGGVADDGERVRAGGAVVGDAAGP